MPQDLTKYNSFSAWLQKQKDKLWQNFGHAPLFKDYDPNKIIDFIQNGIKQDHVSISPEKEKEVINTIKAKGKNFQAAARYISNLYLKGAGLSMYEQQDKLLRQVIRKEIKKVLNELKEGGPGSGPVKHSASKKMVQVKKYRLPKGHWIEKDINGEYKIMDAGITVDSDKDKNKLIKRYTKDWKNIKENTSTI